MPKIPITTEETDDIFSYGFGKNLTRSLSKQIKDVPTGEIIQSAVNPTTIESGRTIGGWTIGEDKLYNKKITIDAKIGRITLSDGTNNRVLIGTHGGGF